MKRRFSLDSNLYKFHYHLNAVTYVLLSALSLFLVEMMNVKALSKALALPLMICECGTFICPSIAEQVNLHSLHDRSSLTVLLR